MPRVVGRERRGLTICVHVRAHGYAHTQAYNCCLYICISLGKGVGCVMARALQSLPLMASGPAVTFGQDSNSASSSDGPDKQDDNQQQGDPKGASSADKVQCTFEPVYNDGKLVDLQYLTCKAVVADGGAGPNPAETKAVSDANMGAGNSTSSQVKVLLNELYADANKHLTKDAEGFIQRLFSLMQQRMVDHDKYMQFRNEFIELKNKEKAKAAAGKAAEKPLTGAQRATQNKIMDAITKLLENVRLKTKQVQDYTVRTNADTKWKLHVEGVLRGMHAELLGLQIRVLSLHATTNDVAALLSNYNEEVATHKSSFIDLPKPPIGLGLSSGQGYEPPQAYTHRASFDPILFFQEWITHLNTNNVALSTYPTSADVALQPLTSCLGEHVGKKEKATLNSFVKKLREALITFCKSPTALSRFKVKKTAQVTAYCIRMLGSYDTDGTLAFTVKGDKWDLRDIKEPLIKLFNGVIGLLQE